MPAPGETETPQHVIDKNVDAYLAKKKKVAAIAKELGVSRAAVYLWIKKRTDIDRVRVRRRLAMAPQSIEKAEKRDLATENAMLVEENAKLWNKLRELMLKYGEI